MSFNNEKHAKSLYLKIPPERSEDLLKNCLCQLISLLTCVGFFLGRKTKPPRHSRTNPNIPRSLSGWNRNCSIVDGPRGRHHTQRCGAALAFARSNWKFSHHGGLDQGTYLLLRLLLVVTERVPREINLRSSSKTHAVTDVSVGFWPPCWSPSGVLIQISINLGKTFLRISC